MAPSTILIPNLDDYIFLVSGDFTDTQTVKNLNVFKRNPGLGGLIYNEGYPLEGKTVKIYKGKTLFSTVNTDEDGWYMCVFKYTGKPTTFTIKVDGYADQTVTMKSNKFLCVNFGEII